MTMTIETARARLQSLYAELKARQTRLARDLGEPLNADSSERAVEMEDDAPMEAQAELVAREIASVGRALVRIDNGSYGECVRCGAEIDPRRLEARPKRRCASPAPAGNRDWP